MQNMGGKTALGLDNNVGALLCYINICLPIGFIYSIIVLVTDKTNKLPRFHAMQSLLLWVAAIIVIVPLYVIAIVGALVVDANLGLPVVTGIFGLLIVGFGIALFVLTVMSAIKAYGGQIYKVPVVGNFADKFSN